MKIAAIDPESPLFGYVRPGHRLVSVNGEAVEDTVDFHFKLADERVSLIFQDDSGRELAFQFDDVSADQLGVTLDDRKIKLCKNDCIFCFVLQQPAGMRRTVYLKDEDYRLSFTHGNFVTLSNMTDADLERVIRQRLSPLYISVHATNDTLRRCMLRNERLAPIIPRLRQLAEGGITLHTQVVLCPGINDGAELERTVNELIDLHPAVESLAVVPVGLTRFRDHLPNLRTYRPDEAGEIIDYLESRQRQFLREEGTRFLWPADEFYTIAGRSFPGLASYEQLPQFENGIGMARHFVTTFNRKRRFLANLDRSRRLLMLTGASAYSFLSRDIMPAVRDQFGLQVQLDLVPNRFWGESVTVSGLLTGQDMLRHARKRVADFDLLVLPPNCLNDDDLFLDNLSLEQFQRALGKPVLLGQYDMAATLREALAA